MLEGLHQHHQYMAVIDAWILEVEEASQLTEEIEARIRDKDALIAIGKDPSPILVGARRKLMILGTKLDRLESLLHNPPAKPVLNQNDLQSRKDMISDMRQRTRQLANCLCTSKFTTKQDAREPDTSAKLTISNNVQGVCHDFTYAKAHPSSFIDTRFIFFHGFHIKGFQFQRQ
eukprot:TRINITY_DN7174_c0_g1_i3.p1 TRINITY_DN7174_c0_g1~~TRINITY_DN7174_c0_g1_i3.p1  ORF type:complete len:174 (-),score=22.60 TRINITY_DN7174_c0_g1_i3:342-863(-)